VVRAEGLFRDLDGPQVQRLRLGQATFVAVDVAENP
jgi:hypothetical protein